MVPATQEVEAGGLLESRRSRLQLAMIIPLCSIPDDRARPCFKKQNRPGTVAHAYNPSTLGGQGGRTAWGQEFEPSMGSITRPHLYQKKKNYPSLVAHACGSSYLEG